MGKETLHRFPWPDVRNCREKLQSHDRDPPRWGIVCSSPPGTRCVLAPGLPRLVTGVSLRTGGTGVMPVDILQHGEQLLGVSPPGDRDQPFGGALVVLRRKCLPKGSRL